ncbi:hypothetical protein G9A89_002712 [Geosiphon pyriformis]|nr:hypothetical protein G9A89_002712 [Geosiphon pyriformis]
MCNVHELNNPAKQDDVIRWHKNMNNLVSIFTESKLKGKMLIVVNSSLAKHVCKVFEVPSWLLSIKFLFRNKLSVSILELYVGASSVVWFFQAGEINFFIAKAINKSSFVILGGDFNENGLHKCASFKKCFDLDLINSLGGSSFVKSPTWCNSHGITKTIDYMFVSSNLVGMVVDRGVDDIENYFNTDHKTVYVSVGLSGLLNVQLNSLHKQANRNCWKYNIKNASKIKWSKFRNATAANAVMFSNEFVMVLLAGETFKKKWFKGFDCVFNKISFQFYKLELLVSKLVKAFWLVSNGDFALLLDTWNRLDSVGTSSVKSLFFFGAGFDTIHSGLAKVKKSYCSSKLLESKHAEESCIRQTIERRMKSFEVDKGHIIRSVLEHPFHKVVLDYLVNGEKLVLESDLVKSKVDGIIESWTRKHVVASDISGDWTRQFWPLDHVFNGAFSDVIHSIGFDEMFSVILNLPNRKAAGLFGITNELWKHCDKSVLDMLLVFLNFCLDCESKRVLTNICPIALIETAHKVFSKILSDWISLACSTFDVLCGDNFSVLKDTSTQLPIFTIGLDMCKAYDSVGWEHLKRSLIRVKMCDKFIRFFGSIHNSRTNRVMTDFGLTDGYHVHNGLDQGEVFLPLLWHIFYDSLLCEVKRQESICGYRLIFHFISKTGWVKSQAGLTLFLAVGAFVDDTIWVSNSQAATQYILNITSDFFHLNDISINNNKTVAILINYWVTAFYLTISDMPIFITEKGKSYYYLGIFLSSEGLSKLSLVKAHLDVQFFINLILRKVISDKQFAYLVSSVLFSIISYKTQFSFIPFSVCNKWDALIHKGLKSKSGLPLDFPNNAFYHSSFKSASVIAFANSVGVLGCLFSHRSHDLQVLSWCPRHPLLFLVCVRVSPSNNFLVDVVHIFSGFDLSLGGSLASAFRLWSGTPMSLVLGKMIFFKCVSSFRHYGIAFIEQLCDQNGIHWKRLNSHGLVPSWFDLSVHFLGGVAFPSGHSPYEGFCGFSNICQSLGFSVICNNLLNVGAIHLSVYTDRSLSNLDTINMLTDAAVFFEDIDSGLGVGISGLAVALALKCVPSFCSVDLFLDSQMALDACRLEFLLVGTDFRNHCWIEHHHIANVICHKNLDVNWIKAKSYLGVLDNERADALVKNAALSAWHLFHLVSERFLKVSVNTVSGNSRHFEVGSGSWVVPDCLRTDIDWLRFSLVWHPNSHMATGFTSIRMAGFHTYFMKALHYHLSVAVRKRLYDRGYPSIVCLFCGKVKVSDHVHSGLSCSFSCISQLLLTCISDVTVSTALCKGFVFGNWYHESVSVYKNPKVAVVNVVNFVYEFCFAFHDNIWLVHVKHWAIMEKNKLIPHDGSISVTVSGFSMRLLAGMIRLLGVADALGISFGYCKHCLFYAGVGDLVSVHISA